MVSIPLPAIDEQNGPLGLMDHGPLDLRFERVDVGELPVWCEPLDAHEFPVRHEGLYGLYRARPDEREGERPEAPTESHHTGPRRIRRREEVHERHQVGQERRTRVARQNASGRVVRPSRRIDEHALVGPKQPRSRPREPLLRLDRLAKALLERVLVLRETGRNRLTMRPLYLPLTLEHHKVTLRSGRRDAKLLLEPGHRDAPRLA